MLIYFLMFSSMLFWIAVLNEMILRPLLIIIQSIFATWNVLSLELLLLPNDFLNDPLEFKMLSDVCDLKESFYN